MEESSGTFDPALFLEITFDIMPKVIEKLQTVKQDLLKRYQSQKELALLDYRTEFRRILGEFEPEMIEKYGLSMQEYNELAFFNRAIIDDYLEKNPELKERYKKIRAQLRLFSEPEPEERSIGPKAPPRYPNAAHFGE